MGRLLMLAITAGLTACATVKGVPDAGFVSYEVFPDEAGQLIVRATMSEVAPFPNRVELAEGEQFVTQTGLDHGAPVQTDKSSWVILPKQDKHLFSFIEGTVYRLQMDYQQLVPLALDINGESAFVAEIETLPKIELALPEGNQLPGPIVVYWNAEAQYDRAEIGLQCSQEKPQELTHSAYLSEDLAAVEIEDGRAVLRRQQFLQLLEGSVFQLGDCHGSVTVERQRRGRFTDRDYHLSSAFFRDKQTHTIVFQDP
jgi:hypothetical protein